MDTLPCGCIWEPRANRWCPEAQRLSQRVEATWARYQRGQATIDDYITAVQALDDHLEPAREPDLTLGAR